jgi:hypothetical protein
MKSILNLALIGLFVLGFSSCTKEKLAEEASVTFQFEHVEGEDGLQADSPLDYLSAAGVYYNVTKLKYIVSNVVLIDQAGNETMLNNFDIIDAFGNNSLDAVTLPNGTYETMRFTLGVEPGQNLSSNAAGDLAPGGDMHINTTDGYVFFLQEGRYLDGSNTEQQYNFGYAKVGNEINVTMRVGGLTVNGKAKNAYITLNLDELFREPDLNFNDVSTPDDADLYSAIQANVSSAFSFNGSFEIR